MKNYKFKEEISIINVNRSEFYKKRALRVKYYSLNWDYTKGIIWFIQIFKEDYIVLREPIILIGWSKLGINTKYNLKEYCIVKYMIIWFILL